MEGHRGRDYEEGGVRCYNNFLGGKDCKFGRALFLSGPVKLGIALWNLTLQHKMLSNFPKAEACDFIIVN